MAKVKAVFIGKNREESKTVPQEGRPPLYFMEYLRSTDAYLFKNLAGDYASLWKIRMVHVLSLSKLIWDNGIVDFFSKMVLQNYVRLRSIHSFLPAK